MSSPGYSDWDPARIAAAAATLDERLTGLYQPVHAQPRDGGTEKPRCQRWRQVLHSESGDLLKKRLRWDGHDEESAYRLLGPVTASAGTPTPRWVSRLADAYKCLPMIRQARHNVPGKPAFQRLGTQEPAPFQELSMPFVLSFAGDARDRVTAAAIDCALISDVAWTMLERALLQQLAAIGNAVLRNEWQKQIHEASDSEDPSIRTRDPRYRSFIDRMLAGGLPDVWMNYPVLARILASVTEHHVEACLEFVQRLFADRNTLNSAFHHGQDLGRVDSIRAGLSDNHLGGRSVMQLRFASGIELIYKPRGLGLERAFQALLDWINRRAPSWSAFRTLIVIDCGTHGWMEYVPAAPCRDADEMRRYYQRVGRLACLFHGLAGTDLHYENIVSAGEHPVAVDLETLFQPDAGDPTGPATLQRTDFLPRKLTGPAGNNRIVSGLGQGDERTAPRIDPPCVELMAAGFEEMHRFLRDARQDLLAEDGPLTAFRGRTGRFIFRATYVYAHVLSQSLQPDHLRDGAAWSIELEFLLRKALVRFEEAPDWWVLLKSEIASLQRLDIPRFTTQLDAARILADSGTWVDDYLAGSGLDRARSVLSSLDERDLKQNQQILRTTFTAALNPDSAIDAGSRENIF